MSEGTLAGLAAMVTGAADGIGRGIALRYVKEGAAVLVVDYDEERGREVVDELRALGGKAEFYRCDVTVKEQVVGAVAACVGHFGAIDILVNNAYRGNSMVRIEDFPDEDFELSMKMCLYAVKWSMEAAFPHMKGKRWGRVINMGSLNGVNAHMGSANYNAGKEALRAYTRSAAREWARYGICANIICPAAISAAYRRFKEKAPDVAAATDAANPMGRMGDPERDIAGVAVFLASEDARYVTGNTLFVDGGSHINGAGWVPDLGRDD